MADAKAFLGRGFCFPPRVDPATGRFETVSAEEDIRQAIYIILMTRRNEYAMVPEFGSNLFQYVYEVPDPAYISLIENEVAETLARWEPRIVDVQTRVDLSEIGKGRVLLDIRYTVRATNNPNNLVFPYYLYEGVGVNG